MRLQFGEDISDFLPVGEDYSSVNRFVSEASGNSRIMIFFKDNDTTFDAARVAECMDAYAAHLIENDNAHLFDGFSAGYDDSKIYGLSSFIQQNIPLFIDDDDYLRADSLINQQHTETALATDKRLLTSPAPSYVKNVIKNDPLGLFVHKLEDLKSFRPTECYSFINGHIFELEMRRGIIFFDSPTGMSESNVNALIVSKLQENIASVTVDYPEISVSVFGAPVIAVGNSSQIKRDTWLTALISMVLIVVILWFSIRSVRNLFWMTLTLMFAFLAAGALSWVVLGKISLISVGISVVFTGIAVNYPLHFITHLYHCDNIRHNMREVVEPLVVGNITTVAAFYALMFAGSSALRDLGFLGGTLLVASILFTLIFLPHFVCKIDVVTATAAESSGKRCLNFDFSFDFLCKKWVVIPVVVLTPILIYFGFKTEFDGNLRNINYMTDEMRAEATHTFGLLNSDTTISVFVTATGSDMESALLHHEFSLSVMDSLAANGLIVSRSGVGNYLPSIKLQKEKLQKWNAFMSAHRDTIKQLLSKNLPEVGIKENVFANFNALIDKDFSIVDSAAFAPLIGDALSNYVHADDNGVAIVSILKVRPSDAPAVVTALQRDGVVAYDEHIVTQSFASMLNDNFNFVLFAAGFIVFVFLTISFGRLELSLISFVPLTVSWFWILGIMYLFDIKFNIVNIILATFIFGQGDDYAVFMTEGLMYEYGRGKRVLKSFKNSVAISALIMFVGIGALVFAKHPAMSSLGLVVVIGMFSVVAASFIFPPLLFDFLTKKRDGTLRGAPYTLRSMLSSGLYFLCFMTACSLLYISALFIKGNLDGKKKFHRLLQRVAKITHHIPGVPFGVDNPQNVSLDKPSVIIANHSSSFDVLCLLTLHPYLLFVTNDSQQHNPFYGKILKRADFYPVSVGYGVLSDKLRPFVEAGFSIVVFPEGTRSTDGKIHRFHQGAFFLAENLGLPITPVMIHGAGDAFPKGELMIRRGAINIQISPTIQRNDSRLFADNQLATSRNFRHYFMDLFSKFAAEVSTVDYCKNIVRRNYIYKGVEVWRDVSKSLDNFTYIPENYANLHQITFDNCGYGATAFLVALMHPDVEVVGMDDVEHIDVARNCRELPGNLRYEVRD
ncbi:MAG: 1-acyl-sn-glycerol-3-phosphate acyltransferase [Bacteroidales bacterium]|nr:1-acyl-sn-glycerol-3-phosphate acyltransferase [Bacteroidales bacterium]